MSKSSRSRLDINGDNKDSKIPKNGKIDNSPFEEVGTRYSKKINIKINKSKNNMVTDKPEIKPIIINVIPNLIDKKKVANVNMMLEATKVINVNENKDLVWLPKPYPVKGTWNEMYEIYDYNQRLAISLLKSKSKGGDMNTVKDIVEFIKKSEITFCECPEPQDDTDIEAWKIREKVRVEKRISIYCLPELIDYIK